MNYYIDKFGTLTKATTILKGAGIRQKNIFTYPNPLKPKVGYGWHLMNGEPLNWQELGEIPKGYTILKPEEGQVWNGKAWEYTAAEKLVRACTQKVEEFNQILAEKSAYFYANVTGKTYRYSIDQESQANLTALVVANIDSPYICYKDNERLQVYHTAQQLHDLGLLIIDYKATVIMTHAGLLQQLEQFKKANDLTAIEALTWPTK